MKKKLMLLLTVGIVCCIAASCSGSKSRNFENTTFYKVFVDDYNEDVSIYPKGIAFLTDDLASWETEDGLSLTYEIDGDRVIFSSALYAGDGEIIDDFEFPEGYNICSSVNPETTYEVGGKYQAIIVNNVTYVKLDPSIFED